MKLTLVLAARSEWWQTVLAHQVWVIIQCNAIFDGSVVEHTAGPTSVAILNLHIVLRSHNDI